MKTTPTSKRFIDESEIPKVRFEFSTEDRVGDLVIWNHENDASVQGADAVASLIERGFSGKIYRYRLLHLSWDVLPRPLQDIGEGPRFEGPTLVTGRVSVMRQGDANAPLKVCGKKANFEPASLWIRIS